MVAHFWVEGDTKIANCDKNWLIMFVQSSRFRSLTFDPSYSLLQAPGKKVETLKFDQRNYSIISLVSSKTSEDFLEILK